MRPAVALALRAVPALVTGGALAAVLAVPAFRAPGHRGGLRLADGFRPGRWDARFAVARGPAAFVFPAEPLRATLLLSGPATLTLGGAQEAQRVVVGSMPSAIAMTLPEGGTVTLSADGAVRLHEARLVRLNPPRWRLLLLTVAAAVSAAGVALVLRTVPGLALSLLLAGSVGLAAVAWDGFASLALAVFFDRFAPALAVLGLAVGFLLVLAWPRERRARERVLLDIRLPAAAGVVASLSCLAQVLLLPQPLVIGDPAAYHEIGGHFQNALSGVRGPDGLADALQTLRPYGGLFATGLLYGLLRTIHDTLSAIYVAQSLAMGGAVALLTRAAQRVGGTPLAILTAALALLYPTFPVICGIVQPEPFILLLWTWSLDRFLASRWAASEVPNRTSPPSEGGRHALVLSGLGFAAGLALHPQGLWFLLAAFALLLVPFARRLGAPSVRTRAAAFALGLLPVAASTAVGEAWSRPAVQVLEERHGFWAYTAPFPLGFWLFLDTDGWQGPMRIADTRYARGLARAEGAGEVGSAVGRWLYTGRFVATNARASVRTVLRNAHRLFHVPDNPFRRDWLVPYAVQAGWHRVLVALFLLAAPLALASRAAAVLMPFAILIATYPLYHVFNKYAVPATPFVILGGSLALARLARDRHPPLLLALAAAAVGCILAPADLVACGLPARIAHALLLLLHWGGLGAAFVLVGRGWAVDRLGRALTVAAALVALVPSFAAVWGDPAWRDYAVPVAAGVRHEITVGADSLAGIDRAREAFLLLDLHVPDGDPSGLRLEFAGGPVVEGRELQPLMPSYGLATFRGGRDPRTLRQWWGLRWREGLGHDGRVAVTVRGGAGVRLYGDLDDRAPTAWSLGQWPYLSVYRLMHDGEYRLPAPRELLGSRASRAGDRPLPGSLSVRIAVLDEDAGGAAWETTPASADTLVTGIWARVSRATRADIEVPAGTFRMDLEAPSSPLGPSGEMRYLPTGDHEGWFVLRLRARRHEAVRLKVKPLFDLSSAPRFFLPELRSEPPPLPLDWGGFPYAPAARLLEAREAPPWRPVATY